MSRLGSCADRFIGVRKETRLRLLFSRWLGLKLSWRPSWANSARVMGGEALCLMETGIL